jgi:Ribonucleotide reductase, barrel domain
LFATAFEIDGSWLVRAASRRQKWTDQAQSLNLYVALPDGRKLDEIYRRGRHPEHHRRDHACLAHRLQDDLLPALDIRHARGEVDAAGDRRRVDRSPTRGGPHGTAARARLFIENPDCEACQ